MENAMMDLSQVQAALCAREDVADAFVFRSGATSSQYIAVVRPNSYCSPPELRDFLYDSLGEGGVPEIIAITAEGGAADGEKNLSEESARRILEQDGASVYKFEQPDSPTEVALQDLWHQVLTHRLIGVNDHFMDLGGDSGTAIVLLGLIEEKFGVEVPLGSFFEAFSIRKLAAVVDDLRSIAG
jgi:L-serine---[L-seryl-carrier protein] ligase